MGKLFTARMPDGSERFAADMGNETAKLFYDMTKLLEDHLEKESGLSGDDGMDQYWIDAEKFEAFFGVVFADRWQGGLGLGWASRAAGILVNITLTPQEWIHREGMEVTVIRSLRDDELKNEFKWK
ncbi:MAG: hypothetical protein RL095_2532 [Verrucomicrobiota bacterium]